MEQDERDPKKYFPSYATYFCNYFSDEFLYDYCIVLLTDPLSPLLTSTLVVKSRNLLSLWCFRLRLEMSSGTIFITIAPSFLALLLIQFSN